MLKKILARSVGGTAVVAAVDSDVRPFVERIVGALELRRVMNGAGRTRRDALVAAVAFCRVDDVVARIVRHRVDRTRFLARVAADADLRVDQVLADHLGRRRGSSHCGIAPLAHA